MWLGIPHTLKVNLKSGTDHSELCKLSSGGFRLPSTKFKGQTTKTSYWQAFAFQVFSGFFVWVYFTQKYCEILLRLVNQSHVALVFWKKKMSNNVSLQWSWVFITPLKEENTSPLLISRFSSGFLDMLLHCSKCGWHIPAASCIKLYPHTYTHAFHITDHATHNQGNPAK